MIFVTADSNRVQLEHLTKLLVSAFPGSTIYQHINPLHVPRDVLSNKITGVFLAAEMDKVSGIDLMQMLRRQKPDILFFILSGTKEFRDEAMEAGAAEYLLHPLSEQALKDAVSSATHAKYADGCRLSAGDQ